MGLLHRDTCVERSVLFSVSFFFVVLFPDFLLLFRLLCSLFFSSCILLRLTDCFHSSRSIFAKFLFFVKEQFERINPVVKEKSIIYNL